MSDSEQQKFSALYNLSQGTEKKENGNFKVTFEHYQELMSRV